ncbi:M14 family metallopeptidase [Pontibacter akesuensis]|uniref:Zinc carboxypeptidase n=1 Tax=Pontibacter akesuensis TaxID=388950 RepID=A0A1I7J1D0_9BACT|nr:M14 family metallopeptidase [Pontibacter akesuensis]GHA72988.1 peptidase M14 [Pontibacter akesuensis]SFU79019.1 Zinc carboxypeptidase [Pontibacter akesuensis]
MKKFYALAVAAMLGFGPAAEAQQSQTALSYYLPAGTTYNSSIPTPHDILGYNVGEWHVSHDQLVMYMRQMDAASDRITLTEYARTHENRPLYLLTITSTQNQQNIDQIKQQHRQLTVPSESGKVDISKVPAVVWMGYSVHGNEPSGANAALLAVYHLAAAQGPEIEKLLNETVILVDPSINPDGLNRFASWVNTHRGKNLVTDPNSAEFDEVWPRGRTNHYWFDLNRDWLPLQHPESKGRLAKFHEWKPNVLTDHHEMGTNATFFFQPGIPSRNNPLTPENNFKLTQKIGTYHAKALDKIGSFYYTEESYDDFYYGKGSTYPDVNGAVGILFEQASSRGHAQESDNGVLTFPFTIRNQFTTTLSTLEAAQAMREELLTHQRDFYKNALNEAKKAKTKAYVFGSELDKARAFHLAEIIRQHQIDVYRPKESFTINNVTYTPENAYIVPTEQPQYRLIEAMFEKRTTFQDSLFYDISAWTFPLAFDLEHAALSSRNFKGNQLGAKVDSLTLPKGEVVGGKSDYAYAFEWHGYYAPRLLNQLMDHGIATKVATDKFATAGGEQFDYGTILIPVTGQPMDADRLHTLLQELAQQNALQVHAMNTGFNPSGIKLGSPMMQNLVQPKVMMLIGDGVNSYDAGEAWHLLDNRFDMRPTLVKTDDFNRMALNKYNVIVLSDGNYGSSISKDKLRSWVQQGGTVVGLGEAARWLSDNGIGNITFKQSEKDTVAQKPYAIMDNTNGAQVIGGAIFETKLDLTHPLAYGYTDAQMPIFRSNTLFMERSKSPYANPVMYTANPLMAGYISKPNLQQLKNTAAVDVSALGAGKVIVMPDNPNFRAFWYGTNKLFLNSIFFGQIISGGSARTEDAH